MKRKRLLKLMLNPWTILAGIAAGGLIGWYSPTLTNYLAPLGNLYTSLLQMCVIPILLTAVIHGLSRLFVFGSATNYITRLITTIVLGLMLASGVGILVGVIGKPGTGLQQSAQATLGTMISQYEITTSQPTSLSSESAGIVTFFDQMIPDNIFASLSQGERLSILFFSIVVGIALGSVGNPMAQPVLQILEALYETFIKITSWLMYVLPFGLLCLTAGQVSQLGISILGAMIRLILLIYICVAFLVAFYGLIISLKTRGNIARSFSALRETLIISAGTANSFAAIPSAMRELKEKLNISKDVTDLVLPLGITLNPPGSVFHFALATLFIANLYHVALSFNQYVIVFIGSILAGIAASGAPGIAALSMIVIVLQPLGLPLDVALILLAAIDPIVDPALTVVNVHANCATTVLVSQGDLVSSGAVVADRSLTP